MINKGMRPRVVLKDTSPLPLSPPKLSRLVFTDTLRMEPGSNPVLDPFPKASLRTLRFSPAYLTGGKRAALGRGKFTGVVQEAQSPLTPEQREMPCSSGEGRSMRCS